MPDLRDTSHPFPIQLGKATDAIVFIIWNMSQKINMLAAYLHSAGKHCFRLPE